MIVQAVRYTDIWHRFNKRHCLPDRVDHSPARGLPHVDSVVWAAGSAPGARGRSTQRTCPQTYWICAWIHALCCAILRGRKETQLNRLHRDMWDWARALLWKRPVQLYHKNRMAALDTVKRTHGWVPLLPRVFRASCNMTGHGGTASSHCEAEDLVLLSMLVRTHSPRLYLCSSPEPWLCCWAWPLASLNSLWLISCNAFLSDNQHPRTAIIIMICSKTQQVFGQGPWTFSIHLDNNFSWTQRQYGNTNKSPKSRRLKITFKNQRKTTLKTENVFSNSMLSFLRQSFAFQCMTFL